MRSLAFVLGAILIVVAGIYLLMPADSLPSFFPGHEAGLMRPRIKHGVAAGVVGVMLFVVSWVLGRRHD
jgi:drug/metabolite transporter (DMT)-like permease